jgi:hypothetical protein
MTTSDLEPDTVLYIWDCISVFEHFGTRLLNNLTTICSSNIILLLSHASLLRRQTAALSVITYQSDEVISPG